MRNRIVSLRKFQAQIALTGPSFTGGKKLSASCPLMTFLERKPELFGNPQLDLSLFHSFVACANERKERGIINYSPRLRERRKNEVLSGEKSG